MHSPECVYIHIPFCITKCKYCSFVSFEDIKNKTPYLFSLLKEIDYYYEQNPLKTLYIGGGTPSVIEAEWISKIINKFVFLPEHEITIELNPNDVTYEYLSELKKSGVNRLSIGSQTFNDDILRLIGRRHDSNQINNAVKLAKKLGFENISLDFIYGLPTQTLNDFKQDLDKAIDLDIQHISLYGLKIDEGCYFYKHRPDNLPDDDIQADMYLLADEILSNSGYEHYEISNYSKPDFYSNHNTNYWECGEYYGFGLSAHGYKDGIRYANTSDLQKYINSPTEHEYGRFLTEKERLEENIFLSLRLKKGLDIPKINNEFNIDFNLKYKHVLDKYLSNGYMIKTEKGYALSNSKNSNGFLLSNNILADFLL